MAFLYDPVPEVKANGELSRMRSHKGNAPTLPQTKHCPLCPAKFTRTTHLHRHLRSHTNERSYKCDLCGAEFTRSDLLTRHKKTCGDPAMHRSRRKSCQACAESKVKCNLQYPCSKCVTRGKTCQFVNDPTVSRHKKSQAEKKRRHDTDSGPCSSADSVPASPISLSGLSSLYISSSSSGDSFYDSGHSPLSSPQTPPPGYHDLGFPEQDYDFTDLDNEPVFTADVFFEQFQAPSPVEDQTHEQSIWWDNALGGHYESSNNMFNAPKAPRSGMLPEAQLDYYLYLFFETFSPQLPIIHRGTWERSGKPPILTRAMQACGALFVKTREAFRFISETITATRDVIMEEFARATAQQRDLLIVAVALLQTIGLFHKNTELRESSNIWHGMLVMMIRQSEAVKRSRTWSLPDLDDLQCIEMAWQDWGFHETVKRGLLLSYLHDCCHGIFFSMEPALQGNELEMNLPCDNDLWDAPTAVEWYASINKPSPYGLAPMRLPGAPMQQVLQALGDSRTTRSLPPLNRFAMFILVHGILRSMYVQAHAGPNFLGCDGQRVSASHLGVQFVLHNWLQLWSGIQGVEPVEPTGGELPFACDALPFYWLAQVSLLAMQSGSVDCLVGGMAGARFYVVKEWLNRIRFFLRTNKDVPPDLWKELMLIREQIHKTASTSTASLDPINGVVSFF